MQSRSFTGLASIGPVRNLLKNVLPKPGEGPSPDAQRKGYFHIKIFAKHPTDPSKSLIAHVKGDRDPGSAGALHRGDGLDRELAAPAGYPARASRGLFPRLFQRLCGGELHDLEVP